MYPLIASDLDGTLLDENHRINDFTADVLNQYLALKTELVLATGRHHLDVRGITGKLNKQPWLITSNGATLHSPSGELMFKATVEKWIVETLIKEFHANDAVWLNIYHEDAWLINKEAKGLEEYHAESGFFYEIQDLSKHTGDDVLKVLLVGDHEGLKEIEPYLRSNFSDHAHITFSADTCLEVMPKSTSKGSTLKHLLAHLNIHASDCIAFGDHLNDIEMLQTVGTACVMKNATKGLVDAVPTAKRIGFHYESAVANRLLDALK
ncbi:HAD family hydrolase [Leeia sp. TBRC 13508]|uniref:HAD family hydrolase n=1 Tax=Leeia speluncae TaxID=2884804 RepID=A0ABS8D978_9NEIS|nr:HAD family hydrolase [Leeia speluncae]MCB6184496.1 HAD family hydrolase [Leeia speluncae]